MTRPTLISICLATLALAGGVVAVRLGGPLTRTPAAPTAVVQAAASPTFVGRSKCTVCHQAEFTGWRNSHHDLAMQQPTPATVRGNFDNASFTYHEVTTTFSRSGNEFHVRTDGPDGALHDYKVAYTFGVEPLQQYLLEFTGGRLQALNVCWDTRPKEQGGQRWFHLYPDENVTSQDILHWTGPYQNWNHMCAECHSTGVHKNYDASTDTFNTTSKELDVSCEACHGPGSGHVTWAQQASRNSRNAKEPAGSNKGFVAVLHEDKPGIWTPNLATGLPKRDHPRTNQNELEVCARCHSRRGTINEDQVVGKPPADTHRLALLEPALYEADGQVKEEVFEYNSFIQSRMHAAGVTCTDCHDPHTLKAPPGNNACARCHAPDIFDTAAHTIHTPGSKGSACVDCHMPTKNFMVVHARHDHSIRVPRPDLTVSIGTPNACNGCHTDRTPQWAADEIARRYPGKTPRPHFGTALSAGRRGLPEAESLLTALLSDATQPAIARATAAEMLTAAANQGPLVAAPSDSNPLVRGAAAAAVNAGDMAGLVARLGPLLDDPVRQIRIDTARRLATAPTNMLSPNQRTARDRALAEYKASQTLDADRAEGRLSLGALDAETGDAAAAEKEYLAALRQSPHFPAAYVNLADLYRATNREDEAVRVLREGLSKATSNADIPHSLGLALVRAGKLEEALPMLERATTIAPDATRYAYVYAVALESAGPAGRGIDVLKRAHERRPNDCDVLAALANYCGAAGRLDEAVQYATRLTALRPTDAEAADMLKNLRAAQARAGATTPVERK